jgi:hypothetical protein
MRPARMRIPFNEYMSAAISCLAREMETMTSNHVILNFNPRLVRYVRIKYAG